VGGGIVRLGAGALFFSISSPCLAFVRVSEPLLAVAAYILPHSLIRVETGCSRCATRSSSCAKHCTRNNRHRVDSESGTKEQIMKHTVCKLLFIPAFVLTATVFSTSSAEAQRRGGAWRGGGWRGGWGPGYYGYYGGYYPGYPYGYYYPYSYPVYPYYDNGYYNGAYYNGGYYTGYGYPYGYYGY